MRLVANDDLSCCADLWSKIHGRDTGQGLIEGHHLEFKKVAKAKLSRSREVGIDAPDIDAFKSN
jgi:hypothetical protein